MQAILDSTSSEPGTNRRKAREDLHIRRQVVKGDGDTVMQAVEPVPLALRAEGLRPSGML